MTFQEKLKEELALVRYLESEVGVTHSFKHNDIWYSIEVTDISIREDGIKEYKSIVSVIPPVDFSGVFQPKD